MADTLKVTTLVGRTYVFSPVPMRFMPSTAGGKVWLAFQGNPVPDTNLDDAEQCRIQSFMRKHRTEAMTDGTMTVTLAGNMLAHCHPETLEGLTS
jgi:hypothetical protein